MRERWQPWAARNRANLATSLSAFAVGVIVALGFAALFGAFDDEASSDPQTHRVSSEGLVDDPSRLVGLRIQEAGHAVEAVEQEPRSTVTECLAAGERAALRKHRARKTRKAAARAVRRGDPRAKKLIARGNAAQKEWNRAQNAAQRICSQVSPIPPPPTGTQPPPSGTQPPPTGGGGSTTTGGTTPPPPGATNQPPQFPSTMNANISHSFGYCGGGYLCSVTTTITVNSPATDPDGDPISYDWSVSNGSIESEDGLTLVWKRAFVTGSAAPGNAVITASDGKGGTDTFTFSLG